MDWTTKTRDDLIALCKEKNIKGYSKKKKTDLIQLFQTLEINDVNKDENNIVKREQESSKNGIESSLTNLQLLEECLTRFMIKEICDKLNLCVGTVRRWQELKDVPHQYTFDLYKILDKLSG